MQNGSIVALDIMAQIRTSSRVRRINLYFQKTDIILLLTVGHYHYLHNTQYSTGIFQKWLQDSRRHSASDSQLRQNIGKTQPYRNAHGYRLRGKTI